MREFCFKHQLLRDAGEQCGQCATVPFQRDTLGVLESRIADQDSAIASLIRQLNELRHMVLDMQRTHNRSVS